MPAPTEPSLEALILRNSADLIVALDAELRLLAVSESFRKTVAGGSEGLSFVATLDGLSALRVRECISRALSGGVEELDVTHSSPDGGLVMCSYRFFPLADGLVGGVGREGSQDQQLLDRIGALNRRYEESGAELAALTGKLRELATTDPLTGLFNRRAFMDRAQSEWQRHVRYGHTLSCAMIDVDHFKQVNDKNGHAVGDTVLRHVGALLRTTVRASDLPARMGGDEFVSLLSETALDEASILAERLRVKIEGRGVLALDRELHLTLSVGVASSVGLTSLDALLAAADSALYLAKRDGRNCVRVAAQPQLKLAP